MSTLHFTSDLHLGHERVAELRGFASSEEHDAAVAFKWLERVGPRDKVFVLGDVTGDSRSLGRALDLLEILPGEKHLIAGNHDGCHPMNRRAAQALPKYLRAFESVAASGTARIAGRSVLLSHFPYTRDRGEPRYRQWRLPNLGAWLLHGHTHGPERDVVESEVFRAWPGTLIASRGSREIHVGLDAWDLRPVHLDEVSALIRSHEGSADV